jgi:hypothetical protein
MKICNRCKVNKQLQYFYFDKRENRGYKSICKDCENTLKRMKRKIDWKLENQPASLFISAFKKRFGNHENFTQEFIEIYIQNLKLQATIRNRKDNCFILHKNLVCYSCGHVEPLNFPIPLKKLNEICEIFNELHKKC